MKNTKKLVISALMAAFTCIATMIIKIQTPTLGYIHLGDGMVLLCGIILGPITGGLSAGIGSMFADLFSGYVSFAPATLIIKALTALVAGLLFRKLHSVIKSKYSRTVSILLSGMIGEFIMVGGYFLYETLLAVFSKGGFTAASLAAGFAASAIGIPFNVVQGGVGILICLLLFPFLSKIREIREFIYS